MLASQTQNSATHDLGTRPTLGRFATYTQNGVTYTNHYSDTGDNPTWTSGSDGSWTRTITDFNGDLAAEITSAGVTLELPDLHGDVMATAATSPTATGPTNTYVYTEFGTPEAGAPGAYGWLGADQVSSDALGGQLLMGARSYNSETGRFSQTDPDPGSTANAYDYALQNPTVNSDLTGSWLMTWHWGSATGWQKFRFTSWETGQLIKMLHSSRRSLGRVRCALDWPAEPAWGHTRDGLRLRRSRSRSSGDLVRKPQYLER